MLMKNYLKLFHLNFSLKNKHKLFYLLKKFNTDSLKIPDNFKQMDNTIDKFLDNKIAQINSTSNTNTTTGQVLNRKRNRMSFYRDGMIMSFYLRKVNKLLIIE